MNQKSSLREDPQFVSGVLTGNIAITRIADFGIKLIKTSNKETNSILRHNNTLAANCLDGGFEMLTVFHGASPDREMFPSD
jgi:hypothetical protein